ncbi:hypothetical protein EDB85DRAFT_1893558 [Lactarius pseudohatsudake]|nr:hypothetical protein EDB85DRAFT_1893558 [Lactarius pseudohatsudake]
MTATTTRRQQRGDNNKVTATARPHGNGDNDGDGDECMEASHWHNYYYGYPSNLPAPVKPASNPYPHVRVRVRPKVTRGYLWSKLASSWRKPVLFSARLSEWRVEGSARSGNQTGPAQSARLWLSPAIAAAETLRPPQAETRPETSHGTRTGETILFENEREPVQAPDPLTPFCPAPPYPVIREDLGAFNSIDLNALLADFDTSTLLPPAPLNPPSPPEHRTARAHFDALVDELLAGDRPPAPPPRPRNSYIAEYFYHIQWEIPDRADPVNPFPAQPIAVRISAIDDPAPAAQPAQTTRKPRLPTTKKPPIHDPGAVRKRRMRDALTKEEARRYREEGA